MDGNSFVVMQPFGFPLKTKVDGSSVPSAVIVTAVATCFVLFVSVRMWFFLLMTSSIRFALIVK